MLPGGVNLSDDICSNEAAATCYLSVLKIKLMSRLLKVYRESLMNKQSIFEENMTKFN